MPNSFPHVLTEADRRKGARTRARQAKLRRAVRALAPEELPERPLDDVDGVIAWLVRLAHDTYTGRIDPQTSRETNRVLTTLKAAFQLQDYKRRLREAEKVLAQLRKERDQLAEGPRT